MAEEEEDEEEEGSCENRSSINQGVLCAAAEKWKLMVRKIVTWERGYWEEGEEMRE